MMELVPMSSDNHYRGGRPTLCTQRARKHIVDRVRAGISEAAAAREVGVHPQTLTTWKAKGHASLALPKEERRAEDKPYRLLAVALARALARATVILEGSVMRDAAKDGRLALEVLARKHPDEWGRKDNLRHEGAIVHVPVPLEDARAALARVMERIPVALDAEPPEAEAVSGAQEAAPALPAAEPSQGAERGVAAPPGASRWH